MSFKVSWKLHILCIFISCIFCLITQKYISRVFSNLIIENVLLGFAENYIFNLYIFLILITVPITIVHEVIHGVVYIFFGGKVKFGFKGVYAYAQETTGVPIHRTKFSIILLAPVTLISVISVLLHNGIGCTIFLLNLVGSFGDIVMALYLCKSNSNSYIIDKNYGFDVMDKD